MEGTYLRRDIRRRPSMVSRIDFKSWSVRPNAGAVGESGGHRGVTEYLNLAQEDAPAGNVKLWRGRRRV